MTVLLFFSIIATAFAEEVVESSDTTTSNQILTNLIQPLDCFLCSLPIPKNNIDLELVCSNNPFKVVCENNKHKRDIKSEIESEVNREIEIGQAKVLKKMGYKNLADAIVKKLAEHKIDINSNTPDFKQALREGDVWGISSEIKMRKNCQASLRAQLPISAEQIKAEERHLRMLRRLNFESFYAQIYSKCRSLIKNTASTQRRITSTCSEWEKVETKFEDLARQPGDRRRAELIKEFIKDYDFLIDSPSKDEILSLKYICAKIEKEQKAAAISIISEFLTEIQTNKDFIDHIFEELITSKDVKSIQDAAEAARRSVVGSVKNMFPLSQNSHNAVKDSFNSINVQLPQSPADRLYKLTGGERLLNESILNGSPNHNRIAEFFDPALYNLRSNGKASYHGSRGVYPAYIKPSLQFFKYYSHNPFAAFSILTHEFGHQTTISTINQNGLPIRKDIDRALACYEKPNSLNVNLSKSVETGADYVSATALANQLKLVPAKNRIGIFVESMKIFCDYADEGLPLSVDNSASHPHPKLRVNAIYAAHPEIRSALGCSLQGYRYEICP